MNNNIWIINQYCGSKVHGMNFRSWYFAEELKKKGYHPHIISASYSHLFYKLPVTKGKFTLEDVDGIPFTWVKVSKYKGSQSIGRVLVMIQFMVNLFFLPKKKLNHPDVIIVSSLSPLPIINAYLWSIKYKAKLIFEVRDIWPLSLIEIGGFSKFNPLVLFFGWFEKFAYKKSDKVISLLPNAKPHMESRGMNKDKFIHISNGFNLEEMKKSKLGLDCLNKSGKRILDEGWRSQSDIDDMFKNAENEVNAAIKIAESESAPDPYSHDWSAYSSSNFDQ